MEEALPGEFAVDLQYRGRSLLQKAGVAPLTTDSVLLAAFVRASKRDRILELCAGSGGISLLLQARTEASVLGIELSGEAVSLAQRSAERNGLPPSMFLQLDLHDAPARLGAGQFDGVVCNPPYFRGGTPSPEPARALARHEGGCTLDSMARSAGALLKQGGRCSIIYPAEALCAAISALKAHSLEPKRLRFVLPAEGKPPPRVLLEAKKGGKCGLRYEPPLIMHAENGEYTAQMKELYHICEQED